MATVSAHPIGEPIARRSGDLYRRKEIQDIVYLRASDKISEEQAVELYDQLLKSSSDGSFLRRIVRSLLPSLGL